MVRVIYWFLVMSIPAVAALAAVTWRQRSARGARYFTVAILGVVWWLGCILAAYTLWLNGGSVDEVIAVKRFKWIGIFLIAGGIYGFGTAYTNRDRYVQPRVLAFLAVIPAVTVLGGLFSLSLLDPYIPATLADLPLLRNMNFWRLIGSAYAYVLLLIGTTALFATMITHRLTEPTQVALWALAIGVPWTVNVGHVIEIIPPLSESGFVFNPTPIGYIVTAVAGIIAIERYDAFRVTPIARAYVVDQIDEGVVVYDNQYRMLDYNDCAASLLDMSQSDLGRDVRSVLFEDGTLGVTPDEHAAFEDWIDGRELTVDDGSEPTILSATISPLAGGEQRVTGSTDYALVFQDVSERANREARLRTQNEQLQLLNRVVHHDIRNDMDLMLEVLRYVNDFEAESDDDVIQLEPEKRRHLETLVENGEHVVELTETAHTLTNAVSEATEKREPVALGPMLQREVANASTLSKDATVEIDGEIPEVDVLANEMLASVFRNLLTNAIQHNDADDPTVTLRATVTDRRAHVTIADNGPGLPDHARRILLADESSSAQDSGIGLSLVRTLADRYNGRISVDSADPGGTTVTVELDVRP